VHRVALDSLFPRQPIEKALPISHNLLAKARGVWLPHASSCWRPCGLFEFAVGPAFFRDAQAVQRKINHPSASAIGTCFAPRDGARDGRPMVNLSIALDYAWVAAGRGLS